MDDDCICKQTLNNTWSRFRYDFSGFNPAPFLLASIDFFHTVFKPGCYYLDCDSLLYDLLNQEGLASAGRHC